jgi:hypothetical protein
MTTLPTRAQIDRAQPLEFRDPPVEKQIAITIEAGPLGITVKAVYTGTLSSIPQAIERLRSAGVLQLVEASWPAPPTVAPANVQPPRKLKKERVEPWYDDRGQPCCPAHRKTLIEGQFGLYCPSRASRDEPQNPRGYCSLTFSE